eukprot:3576843-Heterocapsa_arctica.AAC.1
MSSMHLSDSFLALVSSPGPPCFPASRGPEYRPGSSGRMTSSLPLYLALKIALICFLLAPPPPGLAVS